MLEIDGSVGEGGGQVLRTALSLSCMLQSGVRISNIRAGRQKPGLGRQHLAVVNALAKICNARVSGATIGSPCVEFEPGKMRGGRHEFDIGSAGSVTLLAQAVLPPLCMAEAQSEILLTGGTHVKGAPFFDYFKEVFLPHAKKFGVDAQVRLLRAGFYPRGGGKMLLGVKPSRFVPADILQQECGGAGCRIYSCGLPAHVATREEEGVSAAFAAAGEKIAIETVECDAANEGNAVAIWGSGMGACALGKRGKRAQSVAAEAAGFYLKEKNSTAGVDLHCCDQLLLYMAAAKGNCRISASAISAHTRTNMQVIEKFGIGKFEVGQSGKNFIIESRVA